MPVLDIFLSAASGEGRGVLCVTSYPVLVHVLLQPPCLVQLSSSITLALTISSSRLHSPHCRRGADLEAQVRRLRLGKRNQLMILELPEQGHFLKEL